MPFHVWKEESRKGWGSNENSFHLTSDLLEKIKLGCLQRIADSLETIARLLDPCHRRELEDAGHRRAWIAECHDPFHKVLKRKLGILFTKKDARVIAFKLGDLWDLWKLDLPPSEWPTFQHMKKLSDSFDPLTFDWSQISLGPKLRERVQAVVEKHRASTGG